MAVHLERSCASSSGGYCCKRVNRYFAYDWRSSPHVECAMAMVSPRLALVAALPPDEAAKQIEDGFLYGDWYFVLNAPFLSTRPLCG